MRSGRNKNYLHDETGNILGYWDMRSGRNMPVPSLITDLILGYWDMRSGRNTRRNQQIAT